MATQKYKHCNGAFHVVVDTRKGKPIITKHGMITLLRGTQFRGCTEIKESIFKENFKK